MKNLSLSIVLVIISIGIFAQPIQVSENLELIKVSENCYMHKQQNNNGLVYIE
jgi:hypothetical protein